MASAKTGGYTRPEMLAETDWLLERLDDPNVRIIDCRDEPAHYDSSHIPGAVYMNYKKTKTKDGGLHVLTPEEAAKTFGEMGIGDDNEVVVYDDVGSYAGRVWWTLFHLGHQNVRILNGGWTKWIAEGKPVTREIPKPRFATFTPRPRNDDMATADELLQKLNDPNTVIFDTRSGVEYFGILEKFGYRERARRGGHVPSARWVNWTRSLERDHTIKPARELNEMFRREGFDPHKETIVYCQSAARSGHQLFTLKLLGYDNVKNYDGSWKEWGNSDRPIQTKPMPSRATAGAVAVGVFALLALTATFYAAGRAGRRLLR
ncbi:Rhodanese-related sulfurtransferase [Rubrobacter radiotolerans]|uniref:Sulfurtransferase n=1 Tax=Rubrobacter radiotolerans TaxID=42256 RepID=A0A023X503_RUBRA|nr:sulfurtransferase [Rubrobacter radiotolerans]AHY47311.1 Rhodanese-related sulfurtransferase [Rubrobacter radiotolerans]MDX5894715.1 sulfurtransferase [Rubrobacter radiotolerans]SMC06595.1 thiosulfate/3-mercaptopyruvate sulfurtransferase [Rubrobacter radiotolerans DSM 5868]